MGNIRYKEDVIPDILNDKTTASNTYATCHISVSVTHRLSCLPPNLHIMPAQLFVDFYIQLYVNVASFTVEIEIEILKKIVLSLYNEKIFEWSQRFV